MNRIYFYIKSLLYCTLLFYSYYLHCMNKQICPYSFEMHALPTDCIKTIISYAMPPEINHLPSTINNNDCDDDDNSTLMLHACSTIHIAVKHVHLVCRAWNQTLIQYPVLHYQQNDYSALLRKAVVISDLSIAYALLQKGATCETFCRIKDEHLRFLHGVTPLFYAAYKADSTMVKILLNNGASKVISNATIQTIWDLIKISKDDKENEKCSEYNIIYALMNK